MNNSILTDAIAYLEKMRSSNSAVPKIGIGITTYNRSAQFNKSYQEICRLAPEGARIVVVDDASDTPVPNATFRFTANAGIAAAKNKCFELLDDCEHIFLFDDDTFPVHEEWYKPYVESQEPHLMYIFKDFLKTKRLNDTIELYRDSKIVAYSHPRGCMCYFKRVCLTVAGGMDTIFGKWGYEHPDLSNRVYNAGLTSFRYMDVPGSDKLFYSGDEHETVATTVSGTERDKLVQRNKRIYDQRIDMVKFIPYKSAQEKEDIFLTCYFNKVIDPQRGAVMSPDWSTLEPLIKSLPQGRKLVVLTDCLPPTDRYKQVVLEYVETAINPYFQRWISYYQYLRQHADRIGLVFCIDATDVQILRDPFPEMWEGGIYTGDEAESVANAWLSSNHQMPMILDFINAHPHRQLLNAGLLGGPVKNVTGFIKSLVDLYYKSVIDAHYNKWPAAGLTDMGLFNLVAGNRDVIHGMRVNTRFKANETNTFSWFKHK